MSEEQINSDVVEEVVQEDVQEETTQASETATDKPEEAQTEEQQEPDYQKIIAEKAFEARQARREKEELAKKLAEMEAQKPQETRPNVPPLPDPFDDDFEQKVRARDEALLNAAQYDARQKVLQEQEQQRQQDELARQQQEIQTRVVEYSKRAEALGVDASELAQAGSMIQGHVSDDVTRFILDNDQGPLITKYLASNPLELDTLSKLNPMQAAVYLETQVKSKAAQFGQKKVSNAPEPVETLNGAGAAPQRGPKGATFE